MAITINELIDRIVVHHKEKDQSGRKYQQIEIYYRFIGRLKPQTDTKMRLPVADKKEFSMMPLAKS